MYKFDSQEKSRNATKKNIIFLSPDYKTKELHAMNFVNGKRKKKYKRLVHR